MRLKQEGKLLLSRRALDTAREILSTHHPLEILNEEQMNASNRIIERRLSMEQKIKSQSRSASVLVPIANVNGDLSVLFIKRSNNLGSHRGHISFPGMYVECYKWNIYLPVCI